MQSVLEHQNLQISVGETKKHIDELLSFSKNEIKKFTTLSQNEIIKYTHSIDTITYLFNKIYDCKYFSFLFIFLFF